MLMVAAPLRASSVFTTQMLLLFLQMVSTRFKLLDSQKWLLYFVQAVKLPNVYLRPAEFQIIILLLLLPLVVW